MDFYTELENVISDMPRIGLEETGKVRLMNRIDRKYLANRNLLLKFLRLTKDEYSVLVASESPVSVYSTTYWDTDDHQFYTRHHNGCRPRTKVRVRTYVDTETTFLEVKNKDNHNKTRKSRVRLASPEEMNSDDEEMFLEEKAYVSLNDIHPSFQQAYACEQGVHRKAHHRLRCEFYQS